MGNRVKLGIMGFCSLLVTGLFVGSCILPPFIVTYDHTSTGKGYSVSIKADIWFNIWKGSFARCVGHNDGGNEFCSQLNGNSALKKEYSLTGDTFVKTYGCSWLEKAFPLMATAAVLGSLASFIITVLMCCRVPRQEGTYSLAPIRILSFFPVAFSGSLLFLIVHTNNSECSLPGGTKAQLSTLFGSAEVSGDFKMGYDLYMAIGAVVISFFTCGGTCALTSNRQETNQDYLEEQQLNAGGSSHSLQATGGQEAGGTIY